MEQHDLLSSRAILQNIRSVYFDSNANAPINISGTIGNKKSDGMVTVSEWTFDYVKNYHNQRIKAKGKGKMKS